MNAGQLAALSQDADVDHLSADAVVRSTGVTTEAIGADQVWAGAGTLPPPRDKGIGVALIDSGIDPRHQALANRVIFTKDFIGGNGADAWGTARTSARSSSSGARAVPLTRRSIRVLRRARA